MELRAPQHRRRMDGRKREGHPWNISVTRRKKHPLMRAPVLASGDLDGDGDSDIIFGVPGGGFESSAQ